MGLNSKDKLPVGISPDKAYAAIRAWYRKNTATLAGQGNEHAKNAGTLVNALPSAAKLSATELKAVFFEVIMGSLEWAYHKDDGKHKMAAYAHEALKTMRSTLQFSPEEKAALADSALSKHLDVVNR
jgi:hypothetical protein